MSQITSHSPRAKQPHQEEQTFRNYDSSAADRYAAYRPSYSPKLIDIIMTTHTSTGGQTTRVLDMGCGPGIATRQIAARFQHVIGVDASPSMIAKAQQTPCYSITGEQAIFKVCRSEEIDTICEPESIDLITVATAAHWFDMPAFYTAASKVLKPSGSIAMWCGGNRYPDPKSTPNVEAIKKLWVQFEFEILRPFEVAGNTHCRELYENLDLPWTVDPATISPEVASALKKFDKESSFRREFNKDGAPDPDPLFADTRGFMFNTRLPLDAIAKAIGTASHVVRWREAHKEQLEKGEIEDCVDRMLRLTKEEMAKTEEGKNRDWIEAGISMVLIVVKRA